MIDPLWALARPLLFRLDAEKAHELVLHGLARTSRIPGMQALLRMLYAPRTNPALAQTICGLHFLSLIHI